jgi:hypothetical protein
MAWDKTQLKFDEADHHTRRLAVPDNAGLDFWWQCLVAELPETQPYGSIEDGNWATGSYFQSPV